MDFRVYICKCYKRPAVFMCKPLHDFKNEQWNIIRTHVDNIAKINNKYSTKQHMWIGQHIPNTTLQNSTKYPISSTFAAFVNITILLSNFCNKVFFAKKKKKKVYF